MARALKPWMHFRSLEDLLREIDDIFSRAPGGRDRSAVTVEVFPPIEAFLDGNEDVIRLDLPGIDPKEIEVTVSDDIVTVRGSREHHDKQERWDLTHCEVAHDGFERSVALPRGSRMEEIKTAYNHGVLELRMPASKETVTRKVPIQVETTKAKNS